MNNLFQQLNQTTSSILPSNAINMIKNLKAMSNPQAMLQQMMNKNPQMSSVIQASNGNYEQAFRNLAKQMNVDVDALINEIKNNM